MLSAGTRLGPYDIQSLIGEGGMGEVYRARDSRLERDVALKVLPAHLVGDRDRLARFGQEAKAAATLNHPNILVVHDVDVTSSSPYLVTELLEGRTLDEHLASAALPLTRALDFAQQLARGLAAAHARGVVHRDIKPSNVFITTDGRLKILDFGVAQLRALDRPNEGATEARSPATEPGMVMGSVGYMSPEQVRGLAADARSDLFAFGCVLYEMLTGQRAFAGATAADTMSAVLNVTPPTVQSPAQPVPLALDRIVARCLDKEPANRFQNAADLAFALQTVSLDASGPAVAVAPRRTPRWPLVVAVVAGISTLATTALWRLAIRSETPTSRVLQFEITPPGPLVNNTGSGGGRFVVSPNGEWIVMRLSDTAGTTRLWLRRLSEIAAQPLVGTEGVSDGARPIWSPDSSELAFTTRIELKRFRLADQSVHLIARLPNPLVFNSRGAWNDAGDILIGDASGRVYHTSVTEKAVSVHRESPAGIITAVHGFFKGTRKYVVGVRAAGGQTVGELFIESLDDNSRTKISDVSSEARTVGADTVLYQVGNTVYAQRYDLRNNSPIGAAVPTVADASLHQFTASDDVLAASPTTANVFRWHDRAGRELSTVSAAGRWGTFDLDAAGTRAVVRDDDDAELWVIDTAKGSRERLTFAGGFNNDPVWFPDGRRVVYSRGAGSGAVTANSAAIVALGTPSANTFDDPKGVSIDDVSPDGEWVLYHYRGAAALTSGELVARKSNGSERIVVARCRGVIESGRFSDDGRWVAFNCDESSRPEVYLVPFMRDGDRVLISSVGGVQPKWRSDGRELFFLASDGSIMSVSLSEGSGRITPAVPQTLFKTALAPTMNTDQYTVTGDGQRFLIREPNAATTIRVTVGWRRLIGLAP